MTGVNQVIMLSLSMVVVACAGRLRVGEAEPGNCQEIDRLTWHFAP
jgi:hypothetical protein